MTGPAPGKIRLHNAKVFVKTSSSRTLLENAEVYIHLKGYSRARVTHIDVEHPKLNEIIPVKGGGFYRILWHPRGIEISLSRLLPGLSIIIEDQILAKLMKPMEKSWCYVGGKAGGIFIGLKKHLIERLEKLIRDLEK